MAFLPLCSIPLRGDDFTDIRDVFMARPDRVWRLSEGGSDVVRKAFRPILKEYLARHFCPVGNRWMNPGCITWMRYGRGYMTIAYGMVFERKDREMQADEFYALTKLARMEFVGRHTFVSLPLAYLWSPSSKSLYMPGSIKTVAFGLVSQITDRVKAMGWVHAGLYWVNPAQSRLIEQDRICFGDTMAVGFGPPHEDISLHQYIPGSWAEITKGVYVNLRAIEDVKHRQTGTTTLQLGDSMKVEVPAERSQTLLKECRRLGLVLPLRCGG